MKLYGDEKLTFTQNGKLSMVMQTELAECGLACLCMIGGYYGHDTDLTTLRSKHNISLNGVNLRSLMQIAQEMKLTPRAIKVEAGELRKMKIPCILHWDLNHFVVFRSYKRKKIVIHNPATGVQILSEEEFGKHFTGIVLEITPSDDFQPIKERNTLTIGQFWKMTRGLKTSLFHVFTVSILIQFLALLPPLYLQTVVDEVIVRNDESFLAVVTAGVFLLVLLQIFTGTLRDSLMLELSNRMSIQLSINLFRHLIRLPMDYFSKRHIGDVVSRFGSLNNVREILTKGIVSAIIDGGLAAITLVALYIYSPSLTFIVLIAVAIYVLVRVVFYLPYKQITEESIIASAKENSHFLESLRAIQTIKIFRQESVRQHQWQNRLTFSFNKSIRASQMLILFGVANSLIFGMENITIIWFAAKKVIASEMTVGMLMAFMAYKLSFLNSVNGLIAQFIEFKMLGIHLGRLADIAYSEKEVQEDVLEDLESTLGPEVLMGKVEVRNLGFRYGNTDNFIFRNLNFTIESGESIAINGKSGAGKSTLIKCLMGLLDPTEGEVLIDNVPLKNKKRYRQSIAAVMQEDQLLSGTISDNICCFADSQDQEKIERSAYLASITEEIERMPMKYQTLVGDMGSSLSGGQKQRIFLARALYRNPKILFMDEATSHLDAENEARIVENIKQLNITRIAVAHRVETLKSSDRIITIN